MSIHPAFEEIEYHGPGGVVTGLKILCIVGAGGGGIQPLISAINSAGHTAVVPKPAGGPPWFEKATTLTIPTDDPHYNSLLDAFSGLVDDGIVTNEAVGGHSQGAIILLDVLARRRQCPIKRALLSSGLAAGIVNYPNRYSSFDNRAQDVEIHMGNDTGDPLIPFALVEDTRDMLAIKHTVTLTTHDVSNNEHAFVADWSVLASWV